VVTQHDYSEEAVQAARSVLIELAHLTGAYDDVVVVGGWVPELLFPDAPTPHVGSLDVDLALNHVTLQETGYQTIHELLLTHGYRPKDSGQPFQYYRNVRRGEREIVVEVDFLAGEYGGTTRGHRHQRVQNIHPRKARGCDLVFNMFTEVSLSGHLPDGTQDQATIRVAGVVPFLVMKANALATRDKAKDAWDVYYCLLNFPGGLDALVLEFAPHLQRRLVREGLRNLAGKFRSSEDYGPRRVADFEGLGTQTDDRELRQRDAYERVRYLLDRLRVGE